MLTQAQTPTRQFVPDNLLTRWNCLMVKALDLALDPSAPNLSRMFLFALPSLALGHTEELSPSAQMTAIMNGRFDTVWEHLCHHNGTRIADNTRPPQTAASHRQKRAIQLAKAQRLSQSSQLLLAADLAPKTIATWRTLTTLFPEYAATTLSSELEAALEEKLSQPDRHFWDATLASDESLLAALGKLPYATAPGPSGLRAEHLHCLTLTTQPVLVRLLRKLATTPESFPDVFLEAMRSNRLLAKDKRTPAAIAQGEPLRLRPLGIPEVLRKAVTQWTLRAVAQPLRDFLLPEQLGISVTRGCEHALHIVEAHLGARPDDVLLKVDPKNAFNRIEARARLNRALWKGNALLASQARRVDEENYTMIAIVERS
mmetsp:Transcript_13670/g.54762  ORF Transcript_13670/g.54762 Transcript_13670/m.54762 type:complete len:372 (-) Transcript_13670:802-1917(-)